MNTNYDYNILKEEVEGIDEFEVQTHEKIKCSIINLLNKEAVGINIGLAGTWGSGKSTIINLLKNDKNSKKEFTFFYFDAWAHEGDPLRRIFLESLINTLKENTNDKKIIDGLEEKRKVISREKTVKIIEVKRTTTELGIYLSIATLLFTIGAAILSSINYDNLTIGYKETINWPFCIALFLAFFPIYVLCYNFRKLKKKDLDYKDLNNWAFIQNNGTETITEEVSDDEERTSIEFEKFFKEIIEIYDKEAKKKIVLILDNLDRVEAAVSLNLWSTLQTFIQHKNPATKDYDSFKNVFTIIPYDEESLKRIWNNHDTNEVGQAKKITNNSNSFFDKSFQIRIDVPKPILSNWTNYLDKMILKCMPNWSVKDKREIVQVLQLTRENVLDNPKPREIKIYLNQIAFFRNHFENEISTKTIAFFVYKRFLKGLSNDEITRYLIDKSRIQHNEFNIINDEVINELSAIVYGVNKKEGRQTLIEQQIAQAFENENHEQLKDISVNYNNVFWHIFNNLINKFTTLNDYLKHSVVINKAFVQKSESLQRNFISNFSKIISTDNYYSDIFNEKISKEYINSVELLLKYNKTNEINNLWHKWVQIFIAVDKTDKFNNEMENTFLNTANNFVERANEYLTVKELNIRKETWKTLSSNLKYNLISKYFFPTNKNFIDICNEINPGSQVNQDTIISLENSIHYNKLNFEHLLIKLQQYFFWHNGNQRGNTVSFQMVELFEKVFYRYREYDYAIFFGNPFFYTYLHSTLNQDINIVKRIAIFNACYFNSGLKNIKQSIPNNNNLSNETLNQIINFWSNSNSDNAKFAYDILNDNGNLNVIWSLTNNANFNLVYNVINLIVENKDFKIFNIDNSLEILRQLNQKISNDFNVAYITTLFVKHSNLINDLIENEELDYENDIYLIYHILKTTDSIEFLDKVKSELLDLDKEVYLKSLNENDLLFDVLLFYKEADNNFTLNFLNDVLYRFINGSSLINNSIYELDEWQKENWVDIVNLLDENNVSNYSDKITILITNEKENLKEDFFIINAQFINVELLTKNINADIENFQVYIQKAISDCNNKLLELRFINNVLRIDTDKKIKIKRNFKSVLTNNIIEIPETSKSEKIDSIIDNIKRHFNIK